MRQYVRGVRILAASLVSLLAVLASSEQGRGQTFNVTTHLYDTQRTGLNNQEQILTVANVDAANFGLIATATVDQQVDAQPLVMLNQTIAGQTGTHTVVTAEIGWRP